MDGTREARKEGTRMDGHEHPPAQSSKDRAKFPGRNPTSLAWTLEQVREVFGGEIMVAADTQPDADSDLEGIEDENG